MATYKLGDNMRKVSTSLLLLAMLAVLGPREQAQSGPIGPIAAGSGVEPSSSGSSGASVALNAGAPGSPRTAAARAGVGAGVSIHPVLSGALNSKFTGLRDPFRLPPPLAAGTAGIGLRRVPMAGKRGLAIGQLRLLGIVRQHALDSAQATGGMIAVLTNSSNVAYFLHQGDPLYDGRLVKITTDAAYFEQEYLDPEGQVRTRKVIKRLNAVSGEEQ